MFTPSKAAVGCKLEISFFLHKEDDTKWTCRCVEKRRGRGSGYTKILTLMRIEHQREFAEAEKGHWTDLSSGETSSSPAAPLLLESNYPLCPRKALTDCGQLISNLELWARAHIRKRGSRLHHRAPVHEVCVAVGEAYRAEDNGDSPRSFCHHAWRLVQYQNAPHGHFSQIPGEHKLKICVFVCGIFASEEWGMSVSCRAHQLDQICAQVFGKSTSNRSAITVNNCCEYIPHPAAPLKFCRVGKPLFQLGCWWNYHRVQRGHWEGQKNDWHTLLSSAPREAPQVCRSCSEEITTRTGPAWMWYWIVL